MTAVDSTSVVFDEKQNDQFWEESTLFPEEYDFLEEDQSDAYGPEASQAEAGSTSVEHGRSKCSVPLSAFALTSDGHIVAGKPFAAVATSCGENSASLSIPWDAMPAHPSLVLGMTTLDGRTLYAGCVLTSHQVKENRIHCEVTRGGVGELVLADEARVPTLNTEFFQYRLPYADSVYESWCRQGILKRTVLDRVLVCGKCRSVATFRFACRQCGSGRVAHKMLAHHFACAFVAPISEFETTETLKCPNCQTKHLVAGTDFEYMPGENECDVCGWSDRELEQTGHCLNCDNRFAAHKAVEQELVGYHVERLASLADIADLG